MLNNTNLRIHMLVAAIIKAILFYVLFRVVKSLLAYKDSNSYKNHSSHVGNKKKPQKGQDSEIIDAEYRVIK